MSQDRMEATKPKSIFAGIGNTVAQAEQTVVQTQTLSRKTRVINGANERYFDNLVGKEVGYVRKKLKDQFNIAGDALAFINGKQVGDEFIIEEGHALEFGKEAGQKGGAGNLDVSSHGSVYLHLFNGGVSFSVEDRGHGPSIVVEQSYFGNMNTSLTVHTDKESLKRLGEMFLQAANGEYSKEYCHKVSPVQSDPTEGSSSGKRPDSDNDLNGVF